MADTTGLAGLFFGFDRLNAVAAGLESRLDAVAVDYATDAGAKDGLQAVQRMEDGSLAPLDLTPGLTQSQRAYNQSARNAYIARTQLDAEAMASQLMQKNPLNPDGFKAEWEAYVGGTLKSEQNSRVGAALTLDLIGIGNKAYAGLSSRKLEYDRADQAATLGQRADQVRMQAASFAARTGRTDTDEIRDAQKEFDSLIANLLNDKHITRGKAEQMRVTWGSEIMIGAFKKRVGDAYEQGKTPLGPGSLVDAQRVARELSMQAAEQLSMDPAELFKVLMGGAQASQQIKAAIVGEKREQMQLANEAYSLQQRSYHIASEKALGTLLLDRSAGGTRPLFPGSTGDDEIQGGDGPGGKPLFASQAEMIRRLGASGAASLIARDQSLRRERERDAASAEASAKRDLQERWQVAQPVTTITEDGPRFGLLLPGGKVVTKQADIDAMTDNEVLRFQYGSQLMTKLNADLKERETANGKSFTAEIDRNTAAVDAIATRILNGQAPVGDLVKMRDMLRIEFNDPTLPPDRQNQISKMLNETERRLGEVNTTFDKRRDLTRKLEAAGVGGVTLGDDERREVIAMRPEIDITKPSADQGAARQTVASYAEFLRRTGMQVDQRTATWLSAVLQRGNIAGGQNEVDLRKAFTLLDQIETMPEYQKIAFKAEMEKTVPGWSEISSIGRRAMEHHNASGTEVKDGDTRTIRYGVSYQQAFSDLWKGYQQAKADGQGQTSYGTAEATSYIRTNASSVVPQIVKNMGWIEWGAWQVNSSAMRVPQAMSERFAELVREESLLGSGQFGQRQAEVAAVARLKADGWYPTTMEAAPSEIAGGPRVQWKQRPLEWHLEQRGFEFGKEAMEIAGAAAIAQQRGVKFDDAWSMLRKGDVMFIREPGSTRANVVVMEKKVPDYVRTRDGKPLAIDVASSDFRQLHTDLTRDVFQRSREFDIDVKIPKLEIDNLPVGQKLIENRGGTIVPIPLGSLIRDRVATPGSGTAARRSLERLLGIAEEQRAP